MAMKKMTGAKKPVAKMTSTGNAKKTTVSRGSKTAKQMGDMNEREGYNMYARSERSTSGTKTDAERRAKSGPGGKKNIKPKKVTGYRYGDHPPQGARMSGSTYNSQHTPSYYDFSNKKDNSQGDRVNDSVSKRRAGGSKNLSPFESAAKASSKGAANKPKRSLKPKAVSKSNPKAAGKGK